MLSKTIKLKKEIISRNVLEEKGDIISESNKYIKIMLKKNKGNYIIKKFRKRRSKCHKESR